MKIIIASLDLTGKTCGTGEFETTTHLLIDTSIENIVSKIDHYTHEELDINTQSRIIDDINICQTSKWQSDEWMESFVLKIHDMCNL